ncbi:FAD-dependent oxidoreductase [Chimaeribacter arupi]|uniref:FAD-dependent oxidoreductase n=1 Tax=Chimaeribacter arupi TaxID=2060066 RepID=UPI000C7C8C76|nr:FAD-dependent oxidoreductase [Chimaeribacter arupi]PLR37198.1 pyridine nucleotide-disulfide oxidoreductase [Chimaeribacter arupi]
MAYQQVIALSALTDSQPEPVTLGEHKIMVVRRGDRVHAFQATCPHAGAPLAEGAVCDGKLVCPWHKAVYSLDDGMLLEPPALEGLTRYAVKTEAGAVWVDPDIALPPASPDAPDDKGTLVILGAGAAGSAALSALHERGYRGRIITIDAEKQAGYDRTALSKFVPMGNMAVEEVPGLLDDGVTGEANVERITARVAQLDSPARTLVLEDQRRITFDSLLIASGGRPQVPDLPGVHLSGIHVLRNLQHEKTLLHAVDTLKKLVIVGSNFIGMEMAAALRKRGIEVTVIAPHPLPFEAQFGPRIAHYFRELHESHGVRFVDGEAAGFRGDRRVTAVQLKDGREIPTDLVLLATGIEPVTSFIHDLPLCEDGSLRVNQAMQAAENIYAVGDIATFPYEGNPIRIEHWRVAQQQGRVAAINMLGGDEVFDRIPFFWTQHYGTRFDYLGHPQRWDQIDLIGSLEGQDFVALYGLKEQLVAVVATGRERTTGRLMMEMQKHELSMAHARRVVHETAQA